MIAIGDCVLSPWSEILQNSSVCLWPCRSFWQLACIGASTASVGKSETCVFNAISIQSVQKRGLFHVTAQVLFRKGRDVAVSQ